jgi:glucose/arabinose dehydrogenase
MDLPTPLFFATFPIMNLRTIVFLVLLLTLAACGEPPPTPVVVTPPPNETSTNSTSGLTLPTGYTAEVAVEALTGPTQMIWGPDDTLWVAQLAGGENAGQGQILSIALDTGESRLLLEGLNKPTGIAVLNDALWIAAGRTLLRAPITNQTPIEIGTPETVLEGLPTNGRSNGTLTITPDGELLYETSGARQGNRPAPNSGTLWMLNPDTMESRPLATGLKNAYAHVYDSNGRLWSTDVADDPVNGGAAPDELNVVVEGADFGWPQCFGNQEAATNYAGDATICAQTRLPVALFAPHATPVSVVVSPWDATVMLVATWAGPVPAVYAVPIIPQGDNATSGTIVPFIEGLARPQHLLVLADGSLLVSDFETGTIYRIEQE